MFHFKEKKLNEKNVEDFLLHINIDFKCLDINI